MYVAAAGPDNRFSQRFCTLRTMATPFRLTSQTRLLLTHLLGDVNSDHYGFEILKATGLKPGTLYPTFARLEEAGWIEGRWEHIDVETTNRPARRYYRLTAHGSTEAAAALERHAEKAALQAPTVLGGLSS